MQENIESGVRTLFKIDIDFKAYASMYINSIEIAKN